MRHTSRRIISRSLSPRKCSNDLAQQLKNLTINAQTANRTQNTWFTHQTDQNDDTFLAKMYNAYLTRTALTPKYTKTLLYRADKSERTTIYNAFNVPTTTKTSNKTNILKLIVILQSMSLVTSQ